MRVWDLVSWPTNFGRDQFFFSLNCIDIFQFEDSGRPIHYVNISCRTQVFYPFVSLDIFEMGDGHQMGSGLAHSLCGRSSFPFTWETGNIQHSKPLGFSVLAQDFLAGLSYFASLLKTLKLCWWKVDTNLGVGWKIGLILFVCWTYLLCGRFFLTLQLVVVTYNISSLFKCLLVCKHILTGPFIIQIQVPVY